MRCIGLAFSLVLVAACSEPIESVEANEITPEAIGYPDIEQHQIYGAGCNFAPERGGLGATLMAQTDAAYIKLDSGIVRLPAMQTSRSYPQGVWGIYRGDDFDANLLIEEASEEQISPDGRYSGRLTISSPEGAVLYSADGSIQCTSG